MKLGRSRLSAHRRAHLTSFLNLLFFGLALLGLDRLLAAYQPGDVIRSLAAVPFSTIVLAAAICALGYLALVGYDYVAFRVVGPDLSLLEMLVPSFVSFAVSNNAPASVVTAGGVRYRMYRPHGLTIAGAAAVAGLNVATYTIGLCALAGVSLILHPSGGPAAGLGLSGGLLGSVLLAVVAAYLAAARFAGGSLRIGRHVLPLPTLRLALAQLGVSVADWLFSAAPLYVLLIRMAPVPFFAFLTTFLIGQFAALLAPIPGGIGVFEAVVLVLRPPEVSAPQVLAVLLLYRVLYYLLPLIVAGVILAVRAVRQARDADRPFRELAVRSAALVPRMLGLIAFLAGVVLLVTGAIPGDDRRLAWLATFLPLPVIEASHFFASVVGAVLIVFAWGVERGVRFAYHGVVGLFACSVLLPLLRSFDVLLASVFAAACVLFIVAGRTFPRGDSLMREPMGPRWIFTVGAVLLVDFWIALLTYRHVPYGGETWWHFALDGDGPRAVRAAVGASVVLLLWATARLISGVAPSSSRRR